MFRSALPLALLVLVFGAFASGAWAFADAKDLAGLYFVAVALIALRAQQRITAIGVT